MQTRVVTLKIGFWTVIGLFLHSYFPPFHAQSSTLHPQTTIESWDLTCIEVDQYKNYNFSTPKVSQNTSSHDSIKKVHNHAQKHESKWFHYDLAKTPINHSSFYHDLTWYNPNLAWRVKYLIIYVGQIRYVNFKNLYLLAQKPKILNF